MTNVEIKGLEGVALHTEGVDRNWRGGDLWFGCSVALHTEGVDRNNLYTNDVTIAPAVALHTEGVDRNLSKLLGSFSLHVALHTEGVDRNIMLEI